jgi:hypothetical protein
LLLILLVAFICAYGFEFELKRFGQDSGSSRMNKNRALDRLTNEIALEVETST